MSKSLALERELGEGYFIALQPHVDATAAPAYLVRFRRPREGEGDTLPGCHQEFGEEEVVTYLCLTPGSLRALAAIGLGYEPLAHPDIDTPKESYA